MRLKKTLLILVIIGLIGLFRDKIDVSLFDGNILGQIKDALNTPAEPKEFEKVSVVRVKDGDTIVVSLDGNEYTVRMIGINTPESVHADESQNTPEGETASSYTKGLLPAGTEVYLEYDEDLYDPYDRILAYVWLSADIDTTDYEDFCRYNAGALIMQNTYCEAVYYAPNGKYREWYELLDK